MTQSKSSLCATEKSIHTNADFRDGVDATGIEIMIEIDFAQTDITKRSGLWDPKSDKLVCASEIMAIEACRM